MARFCSPASRPVSWALLAALAAAAPPHAGPTCAAGGFGSVPPGRLEPPQPQLAHATAVLTPTFIGLSARAREILASLDELVPRLEFEETPLRDATKALAAEFRVPIEIDVVALDALGLDPDMPVSAMAEGVSRRAVLRRLLEPVGLECIIDDERLLITEADAGSDLYVMASYPLPIGLDAAEVADLLRTVVASDTWDVVGGIGSAQPLPGVHAIIVSQTIDVHAEITALLRDAFDADLGAAGAAGAVPLRVHGLADPTRAETLAPRLTDLVNASLGAAGDPAAEVTAVGGRILVRSASRPFQVFAAQLIRSLDGPADGDAEPPAAAIRHPQPNLRHATATYQPTFAGQSAADLAVIGSLEAGLPPGGLHLDPERDTLRGLAAWLTQTYQLPVRLDLAALEEIGVEAGGPLGGRADAVSLGAALERILSPLDLGFSVGDGGLTITSSEKAAERLLVAIYPLPTHGDHAALVEVVHATIAAGTWDTNGGRAAIRPLPAANCLVVAQTLPIHQAIRDFLREGFDADLAPPAAEAPPGGAAIRVHALRDPALLPSLETDLVAICNRALGPAGDPEARVSAVGGRLVVTSRSRPFQIYAAELIRGLDGFEDSAWRDYPAFNGAGGGMGMGGMAPGVPVPAEPQPAER